MANQPDLPVKVDIGLKAEAKFEVKGEVPSSSLGRLVDALTDSIRPFTERRGLKTDLLRLQREDVVAEIARRAQQRLAIEKAEVQPVPAKLLVPLLERGSCEDITDEGMIDRWANLLASAASTAQVQPRFVGILGELSGAQAECLEEIAFGGWEDYELPYREFGDAPVVYAEQLVRSEMTKLAIAPADGDWDGRLDNTIVPRLTGPGVFLEVVILEGDLGYLDYDAVAQSGRSRASDFSILESLGLIRHVAFELPVKSGRKTTGTLHIRYQHLTWLGVEFCEVCCRPTVAKLMEADAARAARRGDPAVDVEPVPHESESRSYS